MQTLGLGSRFVAGFLLLLVVLAVAMAASAEEGKKAYKCIDAQGKISYRELLQEGAECTLIHSISKTTVDPDAAMEQLRDQVKAVEGDQQAALSDEELRKKNCETARKNLELLQGDTEVIRTDANGGKVVLEGEQRQAAAEQSRKDVEYYCK